MKGQELGTKLQAQTHKVSVKCLSNAFRKDEKKNFVDTLWTGHILDTPEQAI